MNQINKPKFSYVGMGAIAAVAGIIAAGCGPVTPTETAPPTAAETFFTSGANGIAPLLDGGLVNAPQSGLALATGLDNTEVCVSFDGSAAEISGGVCGGTSVLLSVLPSFGTSCHAGEMDVVPGGPNPTGRTLSAAFEWNDGVNAALINTVNSIAYELDCTTYVYGIVAVDTTITGQGAGSGTGGGFAQINPVTNVIALTQNSTTDIPGLANFDTTITLGFGGPVGAPLCAADEMCDSPGTPAYIAGSQTVVECSSNSGLSVCGLPQTGVGVPSAYNNDPAVTAASVSSPISLDLTAGGTGIAFTTTSANTNQVSDYTITVIPYPFTIPAAP